MKVFIVGHAAWMHGVPCTKLIPKTSVLQHAKWLEIKVATGE